MLPIAAPKPLGKYLTIQTTLLPQLGKYTCEFHKALRAWKQDLWKPCLNSNHDFNASFFHQITKKITTYSEEQLKTILTKISVGEVYKAPSPSNWKQHLARQNPDRTYMLWWYFFFLSSLHPLQSNSKSWTHSLELSAGSDHSHSKLFWQRSIKLLWYPPFSIPPYSIGSVQSIMTAGLQHLWPHLPTSQKQKAYVAFLDLQNTFDNLWYVSFTSYIPMVSRTTPGGSW